MDGRARGIMCHELERMREKRRSADRSRASPCPYRQARKGCPARFTLKCSVAGRGGCCMAGRARGIMCHELERMREKHRTAEQSRASPFPYRQARKGCPAKFSLNCSVARLGGCCMAGRACGIMCHELERMREKRRTADRSRASPCPYRQVRKGCPTMSNQFILKSSVARLGCFGRLEVPATSSATDSNEGVIHAAPPAKAVPRPVLRQVGKEYPTCFLLEHQQLYHQQQQH